MRLMILCLIIAMVLLAGFGAAEESEIVFPVDRETVEGARRLQTLRGSGAIEMGGMTGTIDLTFAVPDKIHTVVDMGLLRIEQGFNGETAWILDQNGQVEELTGFERTSIVNSAYLTGMSYIVDERMPGEIISVNDTTVDSLVYKAFRVIPEGGDTLFLYINPETGRVEITREFIDEVSLTSFMSDFREIGGIEIPFLQISRASIPQFNARVEYAEIAVNIPIDYSIFNVSEEGRVDFSIPERADSVMVGFTYHNGHIYLEASVEGHAPVYFILDSGAGTNLVELAYAEKLGLEIEGELPAKGISGYDEVSLTRLDSIAVGDIRLFDQVAAVADFSGLGLKAPGELGGLIGYDLLSRLPCRIDYAAEKIVFYRSGIFTPPDSTLAIEFETFMKIPVVKAEYSGLEANLVVDFGNQVGLVFNQAFVEAHKLEGTFTDIEEMNSALGGIGGKSETYAATGGPFRVGPVEIKKTPLMVVAGGLGLSGSTEINGNIGNSFLEQFSIILDYAGRRLYILPPE